MICNLQMQSVALISNLTSYCFWASNSAEICKSLYGFVFKKKLVASVAISERIGMSDYTQFSLDYTYRHRITGLGSVIHLLFSSFYFTTYSQYLGHPVTDHIFVIRRLFLNLGNYESLTTYAQYQA